MAINPYERKEETKKNRDLETGLAVAQTAANIYAASSAKAPESDWKADLESASAKQNYKTENTPGHQMAKDFDKYDQQAMNRKYDRLKNGVA